MDKETILSNLDTVIQKAKTRFPTWSGHVSEVVWTTKSRKAGRAFTVSKKLEFHLVLAARAGDEFLNTIYHEVAHLVQREVYPYAKQAHGPEFRHIMRVLGQVPTTYHNYDTSGLKRDVTVKRYVYKCGCRDEINLTSHKHTKMNNGRVYRCTRCGEKVEFTGKVFTLVK